MMRMLARNAWGTYPFMLANTSVLYWTPYLITKVLSVLSTLVQIILICMRLLYIFYE